MDTVTLHRNNDAEQYQLKLFYVKYLAKPVSWRWLHNMLLQSNASL